MNRFSILLIAALVSGCGNTTNPFDSPEEETDTETGSGTGSGIESDRIIPPGTTSPTATVGIFRSEATSTEGNYTGNGYAEGVSYNSTDDTFTVDNLAFDGDNTYARGTAVSSLGPYAVYENDNIISDTFTGELIGQFTHRAIYGVSSSGNTEFAIVRTGAYVGYGFGGFVYQRNNGVVLPSTGQATYSGDYAGIRDFTNRGGLEYVTGDMTVNIDFDDFNTTTGTRGDGVYGYVRNREIYDSNGVQITGDILTALGDRNNVTYSELPVLVFTVAPGVMDDNGEVIGGITSTIGTADGSQAFQSGNYYAVLSGEGATQEFAGVIVVENTEEMINSGTVRETGGFVLR